MKKLLIIDNYDSFTYNLKQLIDSVFNGETLVKRNDELKTNFIKKNSFHGIVISPGPKKPVDAGISMECIDKYHKIIPILGVCLGMQCINEVFGGNTIKAPEPIHGMTSEIIHKKGKLFNNIPDTLKVARYHSLVIEPLSNDLIISASTRDGIPMAVDHVKFPTFGVQFHPESFMTEYGDIMIKNFLEYL